MALSTMMRVSELAAIDKDSISFINDSVTFQLSRPRKSQKSLQSFTLHKNPEVKICPVRCLGIYIYNTDILRNHYNSKNLFIGLIRPHSTASSTSIGHWIKYYLSRAGIDTTVFSAHSTRGAAASKAANSGVPINSILRAAQWAHESTFNRFYRRELASSSSNPSN